MAFGVEIVVPAADKGVVSHGSTYVLTGSGFGVDATPFAFDSMNWGSAGANLNTSPEFPWDTTADNGPTVPVISTTQAYGLHTRSGRHNDNVGGNSACYKRNFSSLTVYCSFMYWYTCDTAGTTQKGFRAHAHDGPNVYTSYPSFFDQDFDESSARISANTGDGGTGVNDASYYYGGQSGFQSSWYRREYWFKLSTPGVADGEVKVWSNLSNVKDSTSIITRDSGVTDKLELVMLPFYFGNGGAGNGYYNDVYISKTLARVEIGNAPTWAGCTIREIQNPSAWSDSSITFTVNKGTLSAGTNYVYTVDSSNSPTMRTSIELI